MLKSVLFLPCAVVRFAERYVAKKKNETNALILHCIHDKINFRKPCDLQCMNYKYHHRMETKCMHVY